MGRRAKDPVDQECGESWLSSQDLAAVDRAMAIRDAEIARLENLIETNSLVFGEALLKAKAREAFLKEQWQREREAHELTRGDLALWKQRAKARQLRAEGGLFAETPAKQTRPRFVDRGAIE